MAAALEAPSASDAAVRGGCLQTATPSHAALSESFAEGIDAASPSAAAATDAVAPLPALTPGDATISASTTAARRTASQSSRSAVEPSLLQQSSLHSEEISVFAPRLSAVAETSAAAGQASTTAAPALEVLSSAKGKLVVLLALSAAGPHLFRHSLTTFQLYFLRDPALHYSNFSHSLLLSLLELPAIPVSLFAGLYSSNGSNNSHAKKSAASRDSDFCSCSKSRCQHQPHQEQLREQFQSQQHIQEEEQYHHLQGQQHQQQQQAWLLGQEFLHESIRAENLDITQWPQFLSGRAVTLLFKAALAGWLGQLLFALALSVFSSFFAAAAAISVAGGAGGAVVVLQRAALVALYPEAPAAAIALSVACAATAKTLGRLGPAAAVAALDSFSQKHHQQYPPEQSAGQDVKGFFYSFETLSNTKKSKDEQDAHVAASSGFTYAQPDKDAPAAVDQTSSTNYKVVLFSVVILCGVSVLAAALALRLLHRLRAAPCRRQQQRLQEPAREQHQQHETNGYNQVYGSCHDKKAGGPESLDTPLLYKALRLENQLNGNSDSSSRTSRSSVGSRSQYLQANNKSNNGHYQNESNVIFPMHELNVVPTCEAGERLLPPTMATIRRKTSHSEFTDAAAAATSELETAVADASACAEEWAERAKDAAVGAAHASAGAADVTAGHVSSGGRSSRDCHVANTNGWCVKQTRRAPASFFQKETSRFSSVFNEKESAPCHISPWKFPSSISTSGNTCTSTCMRAPGQQAMTALQQASSKKHQHQDKQSLLLLQQQAGCVPRSPQYAYYPVEAEAAFCMPKSFLYTCCCKEVRQEGCCRSFSRISSCISSCSSCWKSRLRTSYAQRLQRRNRLRWRSLLLGGRKNREAFQGSLGSPFWALVVLHALAAAVAHCFLSFSSSIFYRVYRASLLHAAAFAALITVTTLFILPIIAWLVDRCGGCLTVVGMGLLLMWLVFCGTIALHRSHPHPKTAAMTPAVANILEELITSVGETTAGDPASCPVNQDTKFSSRGPEDAAAPTTDILILHNTKSKTYTSTATAASCTQTDITDKVRKSSLKQPDKVTTAWGQLYLIDSRSDTAASRAAPGAASKHMDEASVGVAADVELPKRAVKSIQESANSDRAAASVENAAKPDAKDTQGQTTALVTSAPDNAYPTGKSANNTEREHFKSATFDREPVAQEERHWAIAAALVFGITEALLPTVLMALVAHPQIVSNAADHALAFGILEVAKCCVVAAVDTCFGALVDWQAGSFIGGLWLLSFLTLVAIIPLLKLVEACRMRS